MSEERGEGLRKRDPRSSKLEERERGSREARLKGSGSPRSWACGLASRDAYQNNEGGGGGPEPQVMIVWATSTGWLAICQQMSGIIRLGRP